MTIRLATHSNVKHPRKLCLLQSAHFKFGYDYICVLRLNAESKGSLKG